MNSDTLSKFQIITRYCSIEKPYAKAFLNYYKNKGLQLIHVIVQSESEKDEIKQLCKETNINTRITLYPEMLSPDSTIKQFPKNSLSPDLPLCMMVDMDEYVHVEAKERSSWSNDLLTWLEEHPKKSLKMDWHMNICDLASTPRQPLNGFKGHQGKQIALTKTIIQDNKTNGLHSAHRLIKQKPTKLKSSFLVHLWSRSFQDSLLKIFFSRMKSFKTSDQANAKGIIENNKIPNRLVNLAFLACQSQSIKSPYFVSELEFEHDQAKTLLSEYISEDLAELCYLNYKKYTQLLQKYINENTPPYHPYPEGKPKDLRKIGSKICELELL